MHLLQRMPVIQRTQKCFYIMQVVRNQRQARPGNAANHIFIQPVLASYPSCVGGEKRGLGTRLSLCVTFWHLLTPYKMSDVVLFSPGMT